MIILNLIMDILEAFFDRTDFKFRKIRVSSVKSSVHCPVCGGPGIRKGSTSKYIDVRKRVQKYVCAKCGRRFNENTSLEALQLKARNILNEINHFEKTYLYRIFNEILKLKKIKFLSEIVNNDINSLSSDNGYAILYLDDGLLWGSTIIAVKSGDYNFIVKSPKSIIVLKSLKNYIFRKIGAKYFIIITNYYDNYVNAIRKILPKAIHIRLLLRKTSKQYIYVYIRYKFHVYSYVFKFDLNELKLVSIRKRKCKRVRKRKICNVYQDIKRKEKRVHRKARKIKKKIYNAIIYTKVRSEILCS